MLDLCVGLHMYFKMLVERRISNDASSIQINNTGNVYVLFMGGHVRLGLWLEKKRIKLFYIKYSTHSY